MDILEFQARSLLSDRWPPIIAVVQLWNWKSFFFKQNNASSKLVHIKKLFTKNQIVEKKNKIHIYQILDSIFYSSHILFRNLHLTIFRCHIMQLVLFLFIWPIKKDDFLWFKKKNINCLLRWLIVIEFVQRISKEFIPHIANVCVCVFVMHMALRNLLYFVNVCIDSKSN